VNIAVILMGQWRQKAAIKTGNCSVWSHCNNVPLHNKAYDSTNEKQRIAVSSNMKQAGKRERLIPMRMRSTMHKV
jgi:hypothetical protein